MIKASPVEWRWMLANGEIESEGELFPFESSEANWMMEDHYLVLKEQEQRK